MKGGLVIAVAEYFFPGFLVAAVSEQRFKIAVCVVVFYVLIVEESRYKSFGNFVFGNRVPFVPAIGGNHPIAARKHALKVDGRTQSVFDVRSRGHGIEYRRVLRNARKRNLFRSVTRGRIGKLGLGEFSRFEVCERRIALTVVVFIGGCDRGRSQRKFKGVRFIGIGIVRYEEEALYPTVVNILFVLIFVGGIGNIHRCDLRGVECGNRRLCLSVDKVDRSARAPRDHFARLYEEGDKEGFGVLFKGERFALCGVCRAVRREQKKDLLIFKRELFKVFFRNALQIAVC